MADARVLIGRPVARSLNDATADRVERFVAKRKRAPKLFVLAPEDPSAESYLKSIRATAGRVGVTVEEWTLKVGMAQQAVLDKIGELNADAGVDGILAQTPMPQGIDLKAIAKAIDPLKDVDGVTPTQAGLLFHGVKGALAPSTARACIEILDFYKYGLAGAEMVVVGRSVVVGRPVALLALSRNATVTWCHTKTVSLTTICKRAELIVVAVGKPNFINASHVRAGATVIDVGINVDAGGNLSGDVDVPSISSMAAAYTPVPGGVGPVTVGCLFANVVDASEARAR